MNLDVSEARRLLWLRAASPRRFRSAAYELGMWVRRKRLEGECRPLIEQLSAMQAALEERFE